MGKGDLTMNWLNALSAVVGSSVTEPGDHLRAGVTPFISLIANSTTLITNTTNFPSFRTSVLGDIITVLANQTDVGNTLDDMASDQNDFWNEETGWLGIAVSNYLADEDTGVPQILTLLASIVTGIGESQIIQKMTAWLGSVVMSKPILNNIFDILSYWLEEALEEYEE
jgi:hypothetical protein